MVGLSFSNLKCLLVIFFSFSVFCVNNALVVVLHPKFPASFFLCATLNIGANSLYLSKLTTVSSSANVTTKPVVVMSEIKISSLIIVNDSYD